MTIAVDGQVTHARRVDVWADGSRWFAGWSVMDLRPGEDYESALYEREPGPFWLVSKGCSARSAILAADIPVPTIWREHNSDKAVALVEKMWELEGTRQHNDSLAIR